MSEKLLIERLKALSTEVRGPVREALLDAAMALTESDALAAKAESLLREGCGYIDDVPDARSGYKDRVRAFLAAGSASAAGRIAVEDFNDLRKWIQERMQGGCRVFSKGGECRCPLCLLERVAEGSLPLAADQPKQSAK